MLRMSTIKVKLKLHVWLLKADSSILLIQNGTTVTASKLKTGPAPQIYIK